MIEIAIAIAREVLFDFFPSSFYWIGKLGKKKTQEKSSEVPSRNIHTCKLKNERPLELLFTLISEEYFPNFREGGRR